MQLIALPLIATTLVIERGIFVLNFSNDFLVDVIAISKHVQLANGNSDHQKYKMLVKSAPGVVPAHALFI